MLIQDGKDGTHLLNGIGYRVLHEPEIGIIRLDILGEKIVPDEPDVFYSIVMLTEEVEQVIPVLAQALASCLLVAGRRSGADTDTLAELATAHDQLAKVRAAGYILGPDGIPYGPMSTPEPENASLAPHSPIEHRHAHMGPCSAPHAYKPGPEDF